MNHLTNTELVFLVIGGLFGLGIALKTLEYLLEWAGVAIDFLGRALAQIVVGILLSPFLILYGFFRMLFPEKPKPPQVHRAPPVQNATARRRVTVIEEEIVIRQEAPRQARHPGKVYLDVETVPPEVLMKVHLALERLRLERESGYTRQ